VQVTRASSRLWRYLRKEPNMEPTINSGKHLANHADLSESEFRDVDLHKAIFDDVNLSESTFHNINFSDVSFSAA